MGATDQCPMLV